MLLVDVSPYTTYWRRYGSDLSMHIEARDLADRPISKVSQPRRWDHTFISAICNRSSRCNCRATLRCASICRNRRIRSAEIGDIPQADTQATRYSQAAFRLTRRTLDRAHQHVDPVNFNR